MAVLTVPARIGPTALEGPARIGPSVSTVALLPTASASLAGARSYVTDALTPSWGATVTGGGAVLVPVYCDGAAWKVG